MKKDRLIRVIGTLVIIIAVFCIFVFGNTSVRKYTDDNTVKIENLDSTDSESSTDTDPAESTAEALQDGDSADSVETTSDDTNGAQTDSVYSAGNITYEDAGAYGNITDLQQASNSIGFGDYHDEYDPTLIQLFDPSILYNYKAKYSDCNSYILYSSLNTEEEKLVYRAYEYAYDHSLGTIFFSKDLVGDGIDFKRILRMYYLDSPVNEQNSRYYFTGSPDTCYARALCKGKDGYWEGYIEGYATSVKNFEDVAPSRYTEAYNKACEIVATVPQGMTAMEKAEYLYRYLCSHTVYQDYDNDYAPGQLYDALILGRSVCDGFANALSLLYNLAGIPCFEKEGYPESGSGHTWDCFCADGIWYNADPTFDQSLKEGSALATVLDGFAFSDKYQYHLGHDYSECAPQCTYDTLFSGIKYFANNGTNDLIGAVIQSWRDRNKTVGCIVTDVMDDKEFSVLKEAMQNDDSTPEVRKCYFYKRDCRDCTVLIFIDSTNY